MTYSLHHVHLICKDLEEMISFFKEAIGARFVEHRKFGTADGATLNLQGIDINLRVVREGEEIRENKTLSTYGYDHIGLQVENLQAAYENLTKAKSIISENFKTCSEKSEPQIVSKDRGSQSSWPIVHRS